MNKKYYWICNNCGKKMYELLNLDLLDKNKRRHKIVHCGDFLNLDGSKPLNNTLIKCCNCGVGGENMIRNPKFIEEEV
jgi:uncharacterized Zn finger protein